MSQLNVRVDDQTKDRLDALAQRTGRSRSFYATEAIVLYLDEYEDYFLAKDALAEFTQSDDESIDLAEVQWPE
ncbi:type II toxin-antitoxin system RelB family antitoxin [Arthrobacter sp. Sr24]